MNESVKDFNKCDHVNVLKCLNPKTSGRQKGLHSQSSLWWDQEIDHNVIKTNELVYVGFKPCFSLKLYLKLEMHFSSHIIIAGNCGIVFNPKSPIIGP